MACDCKSEAACWDPQKSFLLLERLPGKLLNKTVFYNNLYLIDKMQNRHKQHINNIDVIPENKFVSVFIKLMTEKKWISWQQREVYYLVYKVMTKQK